jgi:type I restriction enzyme S subunit
MNNLQDDGWDFSDLKYVELPDGEAQTYRLQKGDVLFNRTNSKELVGKCGVFREDGHWLFASYLIRVRFDIERADPDFISTYLATAAGRVQLDRVSRQIIGMSNINAEELRGLQVPLPPLPVQRSLVSEMEAARNSRRQKLTEAEALLDGIDAFIFERLGITIPADCAGLAFGVRLDPTVKQRLDPHFHHPGFRRLLVEIGRRPSRPLGEIVGFSARQVDPSALPGESFRYIEISGVDRHTGEIAPTEVPTGDAPSRARMLLSEGDIIISLTRPHHGSVAYVDATCQDCIASTGFGVVHDYLDRDLLPHYLLAVLRSQLCLRQMQQRSSGGSYPAITEEELKRIRIPLPGQDVQREIVDEMFRRRLRARQLRAGAAQEWEAAKARFEVQLLGGEATQ